MKTLSIIAVALLAIFAARHESTQKIGRAAFEVTQGHLKPVLDAYAQHKLNRHAAGR